MPNIGSPKQERRWFLMKVVTSIAIYVAPIWAGAMAKRAYRIGMDAAYRRSTLRAADAVVVMPLKVVVDIERRKYDTRRGKDISNPVQKANYAMHKWQQDWANSSKGTG